VHNILRRMLCTTFNKMFVQDSKAKAKATGGRFAR